MISWFQSLIWWFNLFLHLSTYSDIADVVTHECNTWTKKDAVVSNEALAKLKENITSTIKCLKEQIINLREIIIKTLQEENKKLREQYSKLENGVISNESSVNALEQYGRRTNIVVSRIPGHVSERELEETVISVLSNVKVNVSSNEAEWCHRIGKPDSNRSKTTIEHFLNRNHCKKALLNRRKFQNLDKEKDGFSQNTEVFINKKLTLMNENIAFNCKKLKPGRLVHACFRTDGILGIKKSGNSRQLKIFHMKNSRELFPDFNFDVNENLFHDACQDSETITRN